MPKYNVTFVDRAEETTETYPDVEGTSWWEVLYQFSELSQEECETEFSIDVTETATTLKVDIEDAFVIHTYTIEVVT